MPRGRPAAIELADPAHVAVSWIDVRRYPGGQSRSFGSRHIHHVVHEGATTAYSVHVYAPLLRGMSRYEWQDDDLVLTGQEAAGTWQAGRVTY